MATIRKYLDINGLEYLIQALNNKYVAKGELDTTVFEVVSILPTTDIKAKIYLVPSTKTGDQNYYAEYFYRGTLPISTANPYDSTKWEKFGEFTAEVDLSDCAKLKENNAFQGENTFYNTINLHERAEGETTGGIASMESTASNTSVWATDGSTMDLGAYSDIFNEVFPFEISSFTSSTGNLVEVSSSTVIPTLSWKYSNDKHTLQEQTITGISAGMEISWNPKNTDTSCTAETALNNSTHGNTIYTLTSKDTQGNTITKNCVITANHKSHWGVQSTADVPTDFSSLSNSGLYASKAITVSNITLSNQYFCYMYPSYFGTVSVIKDGNNFDVTSTFKTGVTTISNVEYRYYIMTTAASGSGIKFIFS